MDPLPLILTNPLCGTQGVRIFMDPIFGTPGYCFFGCSGTVMVIVVSPLMVMSAEL